MRSGGRFDAERHSTSPSAFTHDRCELLVQIHILNFEPGQLGGPDPCVDEQSDDRFVPAIRLARLTA